MRPPLRSLLPFAAGLALGSGAAWSLRGFSPSAPDTSRTAEAAPERTPFSIAPLSLLLPPPLPAEEADAALAAYLGRPPLAKDAPAPEVDERLAHLQALLTLLPDSHLGQLLSALAARSGAAEARLRRAAFAVWTERDAPSAAHWALALVPNDALNAHTRSQLIQEAALAWARADFSAAWDWSRRLGDASLRKNLLPPLLAQLSVTDRDQALDLASSAGDEIAPLAERAIFDAWAKTDPAAALERLGSTIFARRGNDWIVRRALIQWIARDPAAAVDWALAQPSPSGDPDNLLIAHVGWDLVGQPAAVRPFLELLARREDIPNRLDTIRNVVGAWINRDAPAALAWLDSIPNLEERADAVSRTLAYLQPGKPDELLALVRRLPASENRDMLVAENLANWAKKDPDAALAWLSAHSGPELSAGARRVEALLIGQLATTDPQAALARWNSLPADAPRREISVELATAWSKSDPAAATRWFAEQLPEGRVFPDQKPEAYHHSFQLSRVATEWLRQDPAAYAAWVQSLPEGIRRDQAANAVSNGYWLYDQADRDPPPRAAHADKLALIPDPALRDNALQAHLMRWISSDRQSARAWIESTNALSPEAAARILTFRENAP